MKRTHYIFVDFENIHEVQLDLIANRPVVVILVLGERHKRLPLELVKQLLQFPTQVRLVEAGLSGRNALDFVLAYLIGVQTTTDGDGHFHILSRDKGFNALIEHLKKKGVLADRHESFLKIPIFATGKGDVPRPEQPRKPVTSVQAKKKRIADAGGSPRDLTAETVAWFGAHTLNRPKTRKKLASHVYTHFGKRISNKQVEVTLADLISRNAIEITPEGKVLYKI